MAEANTSGANVLASEARWSRAQGADEVPVCGATRSTRPFCDEAPRLALSTNYDSDLRCLPESRHMWRLSLTFLSSKTIRKKFLKFFEKTLIVSDQVLVSSRRRMQNPISKRAASIPIRNLNFIQET
jgi:hypothetical protein